MKREDEPAEGCRCDGADCTAPKPEIASEQIARALQDGVPQGTVLMDAGYGVDTALRDGVTALGLSYVAGILPQTSVWAPGVGPLPPKPWTGQGRPPKLMPRDGEHRPGPVRELALSLPHRLLKQSLGAKELARRCLRVSRRVRVCPANRDYNLTAPRPEEWLLIEWPEGEPEPTKYWLSTLPQTIGFASLIDTAKLRWRIERDYLDLKQEIGIGHYEGRGWRGFHHHTTLCIAAFAFLISERETIPPSGSPSAGQCEKAAIPEGYRPRGHAAQAGEACTELHRDTQTQDRRGLGQSPATMSMLRRHETKSNLSVKLVTQ